MIDCKILGMVYLITIGCEILGMVYLTMMDYKTLGIFLVTVWLTQPIFKTSATCGSALRQRLIAVWRIYCSALRQRLIAVDRIYCRILTDQMAKYSVCKR